MKHPLKYLKQKQTSLNTCWDTVICNPKSQSTMLFLVYVNIETVVTFLPQKIRVKKKAFIQHENLCQYNELFFSLTTTNIGKQHG